MMEELGDDNDAEGNLRHSSAGLLFVAVQGMHHEAEEVWLVESRSEGHEEEECDDETAWQMD
jgi:hypothetical protein